jgi:hypothetical protein
MRRSTRYFVEAVAGGLTMLAAFAAIGGTISMIRKPAA